MKESDFRDRVVEALDSLALRSETAQTGSTRSDTFTGAGSGTAVDATSAPRKAFSLQVTETGGVSAWNVVLEGSLDGTTYTTILSHTESDGSGATVFPGAITAPARYFRSRCVSMTGGTSVTARILGL